MSQTSPGPRWVFCEPCGKRRYHDRKDARRKRRVAHAGDGHMSVYPCPVAAGWHIGHTHPDLVAGRWVYPKRSA